MAEQAQNAVVRFGAFEVNLRSGELRKHGLRLRVPGQPFKILAFLLERPGEVVAREELQKILWPDDTFVDFEHSLNSAIKKLRAVLGDSAEYPRYIETLPRLGYRFVAPVDASEPPLVAVGRQGSAPQQVSTHHGLSGAGKPTVGPDPRMRRALGSIALLATLAAAAFLSVSLRRTRALPFEMTTTTTLTSAGRSGKAAISPDGRYIAHSVVTSGQQSLWVRRAATLYDIELVPPGPVRYVGITFSPNSETLYYITGAPDGGRSILYRIPAMGGPTQKLKEGLNSPVTLSPNEEKFAFVREAAGESTLMIADLKSGSEQRLLSRKLPEVLDYPAWSPDGRTIACTAVDSSIASPKGSGARIIGVRVSERTERPLSKQTWPFIRELAWLGNRHGMVMSARDQDTGAYHVWYVSYPGGDARKVTDGVNSQIGVSVSADSSQLLTVEERTLAGIWRMRSTQAEDAEPVSPESANCVAPQWTADGRIVFEQQLNGQRNIWTMAADGTARKQLTVTGSNYDPSISSDGRMLSYMSDRNGSAAIWTMDIDGGNPVMVFKTDAEPYPQLSPDGKWIAFTATGTGHWPTLRRVRSTGGPAMQLNDKLWLQPSISPDGKWIAGFYAEHASGTQNFPDSIAVIGSDGGQPWNVIPIPASASTSAGIRWSPDGRQLTYVERRKEGANVWSQPLNGGAPHQLTQLHGYSLFSFDWSRDGKEFALSRGIQARDVVLIQSAKSSR